MKEEALQTLLKQWTGATQFELVETSVFEKLITICHPDTVIILEFSSRKDLEFDLTVKDIVIPKYCPILGIELICKSGISGGQKNSPALDRKDSKRGYTKDNIQVISHLANMMKSHATEEELITFANWIINSLPKDSSQA